MIAYFVHLAGIAIARRSPRDRWVRVIITALGVVVVTLVLARQVNSGSLLIVRDWMPLAYIALAYWLPASLVSAPNEAFEQTLLAIDHSFGVDALETLRWPRGPYECRWTAARVQAGFPGGRTGVARARRRAPC